MRCLTGMDSWNQGTHGKSGLVAKVKASALDESTVEAQALAFLQQHVPAKASPMCGNSICQDRRFLARWMPRLEDWFHYRNLDVSTLKELCRRWQPDLMKGIPKEGKHEALADVYESIVELQVLPRQLHPDMSPPGRPKGEYRSAQHEGSPVSPPGRPKGHCPMHRSAQHEGSPVSAAVPRPVAIAS